MSFHLQISMQRDPSEASGAHASKDADPVRVATVEITGKLSAAERQRLREQVEALSATDVHTIVIHLIDVSALDRAAAEAFCAWIGALRQERRPVHVAALQHEVYDVIAEVARSPEWLLPFEGSETRVARKVITLEGPGDPA